MDLFEFLGKVIGRVITFLWRILPLILSLAWEIIKAMLVTLIATFRGWKETANDMADELTDRTIRRGFFPINADRWLRPLFLIVAYLTLVSGWIFLSFLTVFIVKSMT